MCQVHLAPGGISPHTRGWTVRGGLTSVLVSTVLTFVGEGAQRPWFGFIPAGAVRVPGRRWGPGPGPGQGS